MATVVWNANVEDLYRVDAKAELVDGELVVMHASGDQHGIAARNILVSLHAYTKRFRTDGEAYGDNIAFLCDLPNRRSFSPDCAFYVGPRAGENFLPQPPVFAVEVRGKEDYGTSAELRLERKRADYFTAGTQVVWDVDLHAREIRVHRAAQPDAPMVYAAGMLAEAEPAVPGWRFPVDELLS